MQRVSFEVDGVGLAGDLRLPEASGPHPAVAIIGPMTFDRRQSPTKYAETLTQYGFATLAYDSRYRGESSGEPRCWENPVKKMDDLTAAIGYLRGRPDIDTTRVSVLGICQGSSIALPVAQAVGAAGLATIAGHYRDVEGDIEWLTEAGREQRLERGLRARERYQQSGEVEYVKAVDETDADVAMPGAFVWEWYQPWADRGQWENRYATMSDADLLEFESRSVASTLSVPWLMIHGDNCFLPSAAKRHMEAVPGDTETKTIWDDTPHIAYYDQQTSIDAATAEVAKWFRDHGPHS